MPRTSLSVLAGSRCTAGANPKALKPELRGFFYLPLLNFFMKPFFCLFLAFALPFAAQAGGPWPPGKGRGFFQLGAYGIPPTNQLFGPNGKTQFLHRAIGDYTFQGYGEYGLGKRLWLVGDLPFKLVNSSPSLGAVDSTGLAPQGPVLPSGSLFGLGNASLGLRYNFYNRGLNLAGGLQISAPTGRHQASTALRTAFPVWGIMPMLSAGGGFGRFYTLVEGGVNLRFDARKQPDDDGYSHEWLANWELGYKLSETYPAYLALFVHARYSFQNRPDAAILSTGLFVNNQNYLAWGFKAILPLKNERMGFTLSLAGAFASLHLQKSPSVGLGFYYKLQPKDVFEAS